MLEMGVIKRADEPTDWCAPMVVVAKPSGEVRICVDLTKLNANIKREVKSVQSALSDLKRPPERLQSQCNYHLFIT